MNLLALDTSTAQASVALLSGNAFLCKEQSNQKTHAQFILPLINQLLVEAGLQLNQLDGIVLGQGPGSFTGLRIACSVAKGLAYPHDLGIIPVNNLAAIAFAVREQMGHADKPVLAMLDARMQQVYWAYFSAHEFMGEAKVNAVQDIPLLNARSILAGVGIDEYWEDFPEMLKAHIDLKLSCYPNAASMIRLALQAGIKAQSAAVIQPVYVRNQVTHGSSGQR